MERVTARRLRRLEAADEAAMLGRRAAWLAAECGGTPAQYLAVVRRIDRRLRAMIARLPPTMRHDPRVVARALAAAEGWDPKELWAEARRIAANDQR